VHGKDGKEWILELNDTAIGLVHKHEKEDMLFMRDIVVTRMSKLFAKKEEPVEKEVQEETGSLKEKLEILENQLKREKERILKLEEHLKTLSEEEGEEKSKCAQQ